MTYSAWRRLMCLTSICAVLAGSASFADAASWKVRVVGKRVDVVGIATNGRTELDGGCAPWLGRRFHGTLRNYRGRALQRIDDKGELVFFDVSDSRGPLRTFKIQMHYFAPDKAWVTTHGLPPSFPEIFAKSSKLTLRNGRDALVVSFELNGAKRAVAAMRRVCGL